MSKAKNDKKIYVAIRIPQYIVDQVDEMAEKEMRNRSQMIVVLLDRVLEEIKKGRKQ